MHRDVQSPGTGSCLFSGTEFSPFLLGRSLLCKKQPSAGSDRPHWHIRCIGVYTWALRWLISLPGLLCFVCSEGIIIWHCKNIISLELVRRYWSPYLSVLWRIIPQYPQLFLPVIVLEQLPFVTCHNETLSFSIQMWSVLICALMPVKKKQISLLHFDGSRCGGGGGEFNTPWRTAKGVFCKQLYNQVEAELFVCRVQVHSSSV